MHVKLKNTKEKFHHSSSGDEGEIDIDDLFVAFQSTELEVPEDEKDLQIYEANVNKKLKETVATLSGTKVSEVSFKASIAWYKRAALYSLPLAAAAAAMFFLQQQSSLDNMVVKGVGEQSSYQSSCSVAWEGQGVNTSGVQSIVHDFSQVQGSVACSSGGFLTVLWNNIAIAQNIEVSKNTKKFTFNKNLFHISENNDQKTGLTRWILSRAPLEINQIPRHDNDKKLLWVGYLAFVHELE